MATLSELMNFHGSDKRIADHAYTPIYEFWLKDLEVNNMLEVGYGRGSSMRAWLDYYPNANIYCMEFADKEWREVWNSPKLELPRLNMIMGDSTMKESWDHVPYNLDFCVDDGSHLHSHMIDTFINGFPHVKSHGLYFLEDTHMNMESRYGSNTLIYDWLRERMIAQQNMRYETGGDFYKAQRFMDEFTQQIYSIHSYKSLVVFQKA